MKPTYTRFNGKHPAATKEKRLYYDKPDDSWTDYGAKYSSEYLKIDIDDRDKKTGELVNPIRGTPRSEIVVSILDAIGVKYNGIITDRGKHLFFKTPERLKDHKNIDNWVTPLGVAMEWKFPTSDDHIPIKIGRTVRQFFKGSIDNTDVDELPFFLYPLQKGMNRPINMTFPEGDRTQPLGGYLFQLVNKGYSAEQAFQIVEIMNRYIFERPIPEDQLKSEILNDSTREKLEKAEKQTKRKEVSPEGFERFLAELGIGVRYNETTNIVEFENLPEEMSAIHDLQNQMPTKLQYCYRDYTGLKNIGRQQTKDLIALIADLNTYNPVRDYLQSGVWDGYSRFPELYKILGVTDTIQQSLIKKWFYQCAAMAFNETEAPMQGEGVLILMGKEGIGKTRFFSEIVPNPLWFRSWEKPFSTTDKDAAIQLTSVWIGEIAEIDRTFRANKSDVKSFMTLRMDTFRKPYAAEPITRARRTVFCGTTNKDEFLNEDTGFRRWWVIPVNTNKIDMSSFSTPDNLRQFWAECYAAYADDASCFRLTVEEMDYLESANKDVTEMLPAEDELRNRFDFDAPISEWICTQPANLKNLPEYDVCVYSPITIGKALQKIAKDYPQIRKVKKGGVYQWIIPPTIQKTDRDRNPTG